MSMLSGAGCATMRSGRTCQPSGAPITMPSTTQPATAAMRRNGMLGAAARDDAAHNLVGNGGAVEFHGFLRTEAIAAKLAGS